METIESHPLINVTYSDVRYTRKIYDLDNVKRIKESLDIVEDWMKKQPHLIEASKQLTRNVLERLFILARGSIEGTKQKIDKMLTCRGLMADLCLRRSVKEFEPLWNCVNYVPLPKLCPTDQSRVMITQFLNDKLDEFTMLSYFRYTFLVGEYRLFSDYVIEERFIIDLKNIRHFSILSKVNPIVMKKSEILCSEGYGTKIKGIHLLNAPAFIDKLIHLLKQALKDKVASRIHVHSTYEDLHKHVAKEILPKDYGGDEVSCDKLAEQWREVFKTEEVMKTMTDFDLVVSDESKRQGSTFTQEYLGMPGSFRQLTVD